MRLLFFQHKPVPQPHLLINIHDIRVASPCSMPWNAMSGTELVRYCEDCRLNVYNLSAMTEIEVQQLMAGQGERRICVRFYRRADGTMLTQDCPRGLKRLTKRVSTICAAALSAIVSMNLAVAKTKPQQQACSRVETQEPLANMSIIVTDPDGAVVPGAKISLADKNGRQRFKGKTGGDGSLAKSDLQPGDYTLKIAVSGFKEYADSLHLQRSRNVQVNVKLALGAVNTTIEVTASTLGVVDMGLLTTVTNSDKHSVPMPPGRSQPGLMRQ